MPPGRLPILRRRRYSKNCSDEPYGGFSALDISHQHWKICPRLDQVRVGIRITYFALPAAFRKLRDPRGARTSDQHCAGILNQYAFSLRLARRSHRLNGPTVAHSGVGDSEATLSTLDVSSGNDLVHSQMPVRCRVSRGYQPCSDFHVMPWLHLGVQNWPIPIDDLRVRHFSSQFPDLTAVVGECEGRFRHPLVECIIACRDGVAEGRRVRKVAVLGLGRLDRIMALLPA